MQYPTYFAILLLALFTTSCGRPLAEFMVGGQPKAAEPVQFTQQAPQAVSYRWDFGDGKTSTEASPLHRYLGSGSYAVKLTVTDAKGKSRTEKKTVQVLPPDRCLAAIETPFGTMILHLFDQTPQHQDNFVKLVEQHYYDSLLFHRVINGFMIQGGDPKSRTAKAGEQLGTGGPDYTIPAEFVDSLAHVKGALAAARTNNPEKRSSGSQFYIVQGQPAKTRDLDMQEARHNFRYPSSVRDAYHQLGGTPFLDQDYTVFGRVIEGMDVIDKIAAVRTDANNRPLENVWMIVRLIR